MARQIGRFPIFETSATALRGTNGIYGMYTSTDRFIVKKCGKSHDDDLNLIGAGLAQLIGAGLARCP